MDKSWLRKPRLSNEYREGVYKFLDFAATHARVSGMLACPCVKCVNAFVLSTDEVLDHVMVYGFSPGYEFWYHHGESLSNMPNIEDLNTSDHFVGSSGLELMLHDVFQMDGVGQTTQPMEELNEDTDKFLRMIQDLQQPLYEGCKLSKLETVVRLNHLKCLHGWSNNSMDQLLNFLKVLLPDDAKLPKDCHEGKNIIKDLGLGYEKIHACPNNCMLFWGEKATDDVCSTCGESRWIQEENDKKKTAAKVLRWFPLKQRLQRLFMSSKTASEMMWHAEKRNNDGILRHPADSPAWKEFDNRFKGFSSDPRNVRLGLACDGFSPFRNMSSPYSIWPVILIHYNLPPWICMKRSSMMLSLLIPGPNSPTTNIDVFLQPLVKELKELWDIGINTYDASTKQVFQLHAALMWTINDFPAYGDLSGWNTKCAFACPSCNHGTKYMRLQNGGKYCYMGHRRFLDVNHVFRKDKNSFDGTEEFDIAPMMLSGDDVLAQTEGTLLYPWKKRSIFFDLPYWRHHQFRHQIDFMHTEHNVANNIIGTLLKLENTKDNIKARLDLEAMGIRSELHPIRVENKLYIPPACFTMSTDERTCMLSVLKKVKVPDGYASNISRAVKLKQRKIIGLKSHDTHILMQQLLPIALRGSLPNYVIAPLIELCAYFRGVCSKALVIKEVEQFEAEISETLCKLEKIFPPSFFTIMMHLVMHLATEAKTCGPVHYRWMYPIERYLFRLKSYVRNKAYPEGSIAEGYIAEESLTFCSRYLDSVETVFTRPTRNIDEAKGSITYITLDRISRMQAHRYVLFNNEEVRPLLEVHKDCLRRQNRHKRMSDSQIQKLHMETFCEWFREYVVVGNGKDEHLSDEVKALAYGPNIEAGRMNTYVVNGFKFRTKAYEKYKKTQNSGVRVFVHGGPAYYGILVDIIELYYTANFRHILFKCEWADVNSARGYKKDIFGFELVNFSHLIHTGARAYDEPYVLSTQATPTFYVKDERLRYQMATKKLKTISIDRHGKQTGEPFIRGKGLTTSLHFIPTPRGNSNGSLTPQHNRLPVFSNPNPSTRFHYEDEDEDEDDVDYNENDDTDYGSDSDDDSTGCDQPNDLAYDDEIGHEALLDIIDKSGHRRRRGITRLTNIWNLPSGERVTIEVNKNFQVVGQNSSLFPRFLGTMARRSDYCPLNYITWPKVPKEYKKHCLATIESKFILRFHNDDEMVHKSWARFSLCCLGRKWRDFRKELKDKFFDITKTKDQMIVGIPSYVDPTQMKCLIDYWLSPEAKARSVKNKSSRSFQKDVHTLEAKSYARLAHELELKDGRAQTRSDLYIKSRKRKNGEPVSEIARQNIKDMEKLMAEQEVDPSDGVCGKIVYGEGDVYSQVISKEERNGRVRGLGFAPSAPRIHSASNSTYYELVEQHRNDVNTIKVLHEQILKNEAERIEKDKKLEEIILQQVAENNEMAQRIKMIEQLIPGMHICGPANEVSPGFQQKSSCASRPDRDPEGDQALN